MLYLGDSYAFLRLIIEKVYPPSEIRKMSGVI